MSDAPEYPYPEDGGRTHYWGCFRERGHHNCAVAEVARLEAEVARLRETLVEVESETAQIWPQSLLDDMPALRRIQDIVRRALNRETRDE